MFILFTDSFFCMIYVSNVCLYYSLKFDQNKKTIKNIFVVYQTFNYKYECML